MIRLVQVFNTLIQSGGEKGEESMYDVVMHHLTDHAITTGFIGKINIQIESLIGGKLFGIFDMRITRWVLMMWLALFLCVIIFIPVARSIKKSTMGSKSRWINMWESLIGFVHDEIVEPNFDHKYIRKAMPYFSSVFFFILFCNLLGLIPGLSTATGNLAVTAGMASFTFLLMILVGMVKQGPLWIFTGIVPHGIPFVMYFLLWPIEIAGLIIKPFALTVRLFANMTAGHIVIIIFIYLVMMFQNYFVGIGSIAGSLMIYMLELLVAFIQAYIFATLSAMFIGSSMHAH
ncbi:MAG: F0F1 ATP synthase subunit A [Spirochaetes bacterium]|jgi:F-type H+-transporting ATPase subunit a|nr:F0F1 ATP synthase subunit A [Spirochaetota bacterium]